MINFLSPVLAAPIPPDLPEESSGGITNPALGPGLQGILEGEGGAGFLQRFLPALVNLFFIVGTVIFLFMLIWGAIAWISSGGDKAAIESARGRITAALVGIVVLLSTFAIIVVIESFFGVDILTLDISVLRIR